MAKKTATAVATDAKKLGTKPFLDSPNGEDFFASAFVLFEKGELTATDYLRASEPDAYPFKETVTNPEDFVLYFRFFETAPPELLACVGNVIGKVNSVVMAKAIMAVESLRPQIWPNTKDPSTVPYQPDNGVDKYVVQKTYLDGLPAYFDYETEFCFSWVPDKKKAHVFATFDDAFVFAKRTEAAHAERIRDVKAAASNVVILPVN